MSPVPFILTSGHTFGAQFLRGLLLSEVCRDGAIEPRLVLALHPRFAADTAGYADLRFVCNEFGVPIIHFDRVNDAAVLSQLERIPHCYHFAVGLSQLLPKEILAMPSMHCGASSLYSESHGAIGAHPTLLPEGRGRAPIPWTILKQRQNTGVTAFFLETEADAGPIIETEPFDITPAETATTLFERAALAHQALGRRLAPKIASRSVLHRPQNHSLAEIWSRRTKQDGWLDFEQPAAELERLIRAVSAPYPPAFFVIGNCAVYVHSAIVSSSVPPRSVPGQLLRVDASAIEIATGDGVLRITDYFAWPQGVLKSGFIATTSRNSGGGLDNA